jgi:monothiol glutaredoxin
MAVGNILKILEVKFKGINVLDDQSLREGIKAFSEWPTIPQLYIKKEFIGGCDIIKEMYENGELKKILEEKGRHSRAAISVNSLPLGAAVEIEAIFEVN